MSRVCENWSLKRSEFRTTGSLGLVFLKRYKTKEKSQMFLREENLAVLTFTVLSDEWCGFGSFYAITLTEKS